MKKKKNETNKKDQTAFKENIEIRGERKSRRVAEKRRLHQHVEARKRFKYLKQVCRNCTI